ALANVRKHAHAHSAWISFEALGDSGLQLVVRDDGQGFDPETAAPDQEHAARRSFGLAGMRERVESLGGELKFDSRPGGGTRVIVSIPFKSRAGRIRGGSLAPAAR
ncbi:MAG TPA: ATP-binding protein, partial [Chloroflexota bacterium]